MCGMGFDAESAWLLLCQLPKQEASRLYSRQNSGTLTDDDLCLVLKSLDARARPLEGQGLH